MLPFACCCRTRCSVVCSMLIHEVQKWKAKVRKKESEQSEKESPRLSSVLERSWHSDAALLAGHLRLVVPFQCHMSFKEPAPLAAMQHLFLVCLLPFWTAALLQGHLMDGILQKKDNLRWWPPHCQPPCAPHWTPGPISRLQKHINKRDIFLPSRTMSPSSTPPVSWQCTRWPHICKPFPKVDITFTSALPLPWT